jgi:hypothetical protein
MAKGMNSFVMTTDLDVKHKTLIRKQGLAGYAI